MAILHHPYHPTKSQPSTTKFLLLFLVIPIHMAFSLSETDALLQFKKSLVNTVALDATWTPMSPPCGGKAAWAGVMCYKISIAGIRLESMGLSGKIDVEALTNLQGLRIVSFINNRFDGPIPDLNRLGSLKALYISGNQFTGEIPPDYFTKMTSLKKVWLAKNRFSGPIPPSLARLQYIMELHLEDNQFTGPIPPFTQPPLVYFNVSNNKLEGEVPKSLSMIDKSSFAGNTGLCGPEVGNECKKKDVPEKTEEKPASESPPSTPGGAKEDSSNGINAVAVVLAVVFVMLFVLVCVMRKKKGDENDRLEGSKVGKSESANRSGKLDNPLATPQAGSAAGGSTRKGNPSKKAAISASAGELVMVNEEKGVFGLQDLMKAAAEVLGSGGMGAAYKAKMSNGVSVTVKRTRNMNRLGKDAFDAELRRLAGLKHQNLLPPLAYHFRKEEKLLVYEYKPKKSLLYGLHGDGKTSSGNLDWPARRKIINGVARGLGFLHTQLASSEVPHGNLKSSNILIHDDEEPVMAEYGFSTITSANKMQQSLLAYKAPEAIQSKKVTPKCDLYCFGVVILETLTGKFPSVYLPSNNKGGVDVAQWVVSAVNENREAELLDPLITKDSSHVDEMVELLRVGATFVDENPDARPDMLEAIKRVERV